MGLQTFRSRRADSKVDASSSFKDFKLKYFEEFERNLKNVTLTQQTTTTAKHNPSPRKRSHQVQSTRKGSAVTSYPARHLAKCLTETVHDFQWEVPDIGSPVKSRKGQSEVGNRTTSNFVFLISRVPCDKKTLRYYSNKMVMDKDIFIESFMSQMLQREFCDQRNIHLYWVDTGRYLAPTDASAAVPDKKSYEIVETSLKSLGGALVPFQSIVTHLTAPDQQRHFAQVGLASGDANAESSGTSRTAAGGQKDGQRGKDELAVLLSSFAAMSACRAFVASGGTQGKTSVSSQPEECATPGVVTLTMGEKDSEDSDPMQVSLKLTPVTKAGTSRLPVPQGPNQLDLQLCVDSDTCWCTVKVSRKTPHTHAATHLGMRGRIKNLSLDSLGQI